MSPSGGGGTHLDAKLGDLLERRKAHNRFRSLTVIPDSAVDFSSNGYLSIAANPEVQRAYVSRLQRVIAPLTVAEREEKVGSLQPQALLGSGGSRLLDGNSGFAEQLERRIAVHHSAPAALLFVSAFDANVGLLGCVPQPGDAVVYDELVHASVHDGLRLSRAGRRLPFAHASVVDVEGCDDEAEVAMEGPRGLGGVLRALAGDDADVREGRRSVFVYVESLYSMDGDVLRLRDVVDCVERHLPRKNGYIILDEAHSTGIFGEGGGGLACELGLEDRVWARVLGLGKAMGCAGGVILCSEVTRSYLINYARSLIYTTSTPLTSLLSIDVVYDYITSKKADVHRKHLQNLIRYTHQSLLELCAYQVPLPPNHLLGVRKRPPKSPIIPVLTAYPRSLAAYCQGRGFMVRPIVPPTVPPGSERVRICLHAGNTTAQIEGLCRTMGEWLQLQNKNSKNTTQKMMERQTQVPLAQEPNIKKAKL